MKKVKKVKRRKKRAVERLSFSVPLYVVQENMSEPAKVLWEGCGNVIVTVQRVHSQNPRIYKMAKNFNFGWLFCSLRRYLTQNMRVLG